MELPRRWEKIDSKGQIYTPRTGYLIIYELSLLSNF